MQTLYINSERVNMKALPSPVLQARSPRRRVLRGLFSLALLSFAAWGWAAAVFTLLT